MPLVTPALRARLDSWFNALTGLGGSRDKSTAAEYCPPITLGQITLENLYAGDDLARRIVEAPVKDGLREGVTIEGDEDGKVGDEAERLDAWELFSDAATWGRLHGGGFLLLGVEDGLQDAPLVVENMAEGSLKWIMDLDRWSVIPHKAYSDPKAANYGQPEIYTVTVPGALDGAFQSRPVHESRLIRFGGANTSRRRKAKDRGYDDSVLVPVYEVLRDVNTIWRSGVFAAQDLSQGVFKIRNLVEMIAEGGRDAALERMELMDMARSVSRSVVLDAELEEFTTVDGKGLGTLPAVVDKSWERLAAAACMPVTVLFGTSPGGLNATGESDIRIYYDHVGSWREKRLLPQATALVDVMARSAGVSPEDLAVSFPPLWQASAAEEAATRKTVADADAIYLDRGVVLPEEVALSRWAEGEYSSEMSAFDPELRAVLADIERAALEDKAKAPDPVPPPSPFGTTDVPTPPPAPEEDGDEEDGAAEE